MAQARLNHTMLFHIYKHVLSLDFDRMAKESVQESNYQSRDHNLFQHAMLLKIIFSYVYTNIILIASYVLDNSYVSKLFK